MLNFAFVSEAAAREYQYLPENIQNEFGKDLRYIQYGQSPLSRNTSINKTKWCHRA